MTARPSSLVSFLLVPCSSLLALCALSLFSDTVFAGSLPSFSLGRLFQAILLLSAQHSQSTNEWQKPRENSVFGAEKCQNEKRDGFFLTFFLRLKNMRLAKARCAK